MWPATPYGALNILPAQQRVQAIHQLNTLNDMATWTPLLGVWERLWTLPVHVARSVMVLQVFRRGNKGSAEVVPEVVSEEQDM